MTSNSEQPLHTFEIVTTVHEGEGLVRYRLRTPASEIEDIMSDQEGRITLCGLVSEWQPGPKGGSWSAYGNGAICYESFLSAREVTGPQKGGA